MQVSFKDFPPGNGYWLVKWIDRYEQRLVATRSTGVTVVLQQLDLTSVRAIGQLNPTAVSDLLGRPPPSRAIPGQAPPVFHYARIMAGSLPLLSVGMVVQQQVVVGRLPAQQRALSLPLGENSCTPWSLGDRMRPEVDWPGSRPRRPLESFQFSMPDLGMRRARVLIHRTANLDIIIPQQVVFQTFYAPHRDMARAFTNGPWSHTAQEVINFTPMANGLQTKDNVDAGCWDIILQPRVQNDYALILAILWFDAYGRQCANDIYRQAMLDIQASRAIAQGQPGESSGLASHWYCSARFPFRPDHPLQLEVEGYRLRPWKLDEGNFHKAFLVTRILACPGPAYLPPIRRERTNSGAGGAHTELSDQTAPYRGSAPAQHPRGPTVLDARQDPDRGGQLQAIELESFTWINPREMLTIPKESSTSYTGGGFPITPPPRSTVSSGNDWGVGSDSDPLSSRTPVRPAPMRYAELLAALEVLRGQGDVRAFWPLVPGERGAMALCGGLNCWNFLTDDERHGLDPVPNHGWSVLSRRDFTQNSLSVLRSALVLSMDTAWGAGLWIELECRSTEGGYCSAWITQLDGEPEDDLVLDLLGLIHQNAGRNLTSALNPYLQSTRAGVAHAYQHVYSGESKELSALSIRRFLERSRRSVT